VAIAGIWIVAVIAANLTAWLGVPLRIIGASFLAIVLAESLDTEVFHALRQRAWWVRALSSNALSIPADTLLFTALAFGGVLPWLDIGGVLIWVYQRS
jgi:hypothetical protein